MIGFHLGQAWWAVRAAALRSLGTLVVVAGATCSVLFSTAIVAGFDVVLLRMNFGDSANAVTVRPNPLTNERTGPPTDDDARALGAGLPGVIDAAAWVVGSGAVRGNGTALSVPVYGARGSYRRELDTALTAGDWLTAREVEGGSAACLVGAALAGRLDGQAVPGRRLNLGPASCTVAGVLAYPDARPARRFADGVVMPIEPARRYFVAAEAQASDLAWFTLYFADAAAAAEARIAADRLLRRRHGVPQSRLSPFAYQDPDAQLADQQRQRDMVARLLFSLTAIAAVISLFSIAAIMLASARARVREFGIRMAMGASSRDIGRQIVIENVLLCLTGSLAGVLVGIGLAAVAEARWDWPVTVGWPVALGSMLGVASVGIAIGRYAAAVAAATPPAAAAR